MLTSEQLMPLETYARKRAEFRAEVIAHKKNRQVQLGDNIRLLFEDRLTVQYQIQEMLRIEKIFEVAGIQEELDAYNPLIPDGDNWKATMMIEYPDVRIRKEKLAGLVGVENKVWVQVDTCERVYAIADEDLERSTDEKTSSVHFLRFQLTSAMLAKVKAGSEVNMGIDHPKYRVALTPIGDNTRRSLVEDLA